MLYLIRNYIFFLDQHQRLCSFTHSFVLYLFVHPFTHSLNTRNSKRQKLVVIDSLTTFVCTILLENSLIIPAWWQGHWKQKRHKFKHVIFVNRNIWQSCMSLNVFVPRNHLYIMIHFSCCNNLINIIMYVFKPSVYISNQLYFVKSIKKTTFAFAINAATTRIWCHNITSCFVRSACMKRLSQLSRNRMLQQWFLGKG